MNTARPLLAALFLLFLASPAWAYNFLYIHPTSGEPIKWDNTQTIQYYLDPGKLGRLTNEQAHTLLKEAMKIWENASPNANPPQFEFAGYLPEDVDGTNYSRYVSLFPCYTDDLSQCASESQQNLQTVIIFDEDDSILSNELCRIGGCAANSGAKVFSGNSSGPQNIAQGILVLGTVAGDEDTRISAVIGMMVHELGHLLGLAHTVVNQDAYINQDTYIADGIDNSYLMPTMFSGYIPSGLRAKEKNEVTLNPDDIAGISMLYPSDSFAANTATIKGQVLKADGSQMMHVNVIARNVGDPLCEAYSFLSGRLCRHDSIIQSLCVNENGAMTVDGTFTLSGLASGTYTIEVEEVADDSLGLTLAPGLLPSEDIYGDAEFWNDPDVVNEDNLTISTITLAAGESREGIDIALNRSAVTDDRVKYIPLSTFTAGSGSLCPEEPTTDYAALIGIDESSGDTAGDSDLNSSTGGCTLLP